MAAKQKNKGEEIEVEKQLYSVRELCAITGKCYRTIHRRIQEGKIGPVVRLGASVMLPRSVVERILTKGF